MLKVKSYLRVTVVCVLIVYLCMFGYVMLQNMFTELFINWDWETRVEQDVFENGFWITMLIGALMVPVLEEIIFRLTCCRILQLTKMPTWCVIVISAVIFMLYHQSWSQTVYQLLMGIWFAWIFLKTHQIRWTILIHVINNATILAYTYFAGTGSGVFELSAGNIILSLVVAIATTIAVYFLIQKGIPNYEK